MIYLNYQLIFKRLLKNSLFCHSRSICHSRESGNPVFLFCHSRSICHSRESGNPVFLFCTPRESVESGNPVFL